MWRHARPVSSMLTTQHRLTSMHNAIFPSDYWTIRLVIFLYCCCLLLCFVRAGMVSILVMSWAVLRFQMLYHIRYQVCFQDFFCIYTRSNPYARKKAPNWHCDPLAGCNFARWRFDSDIAIPGKAANPIAWTTSSIVEGSATGLSYGVSTFMTYATTT